VAHGHGGVAPLQQQRDGLADDIAAPNYHGVCAAKLHPVVVEDGENAERRAGKQPRAAHQQPPGVHRPHAVHILFGGNGAGGGHGVKPLRQRKLHQNAVHFAVLVQRFNLRQQFLLRGVCRQFQIPRGETGAAAGAVLARHIGAAGGVLSHAQRGQAGRARARVEGAGGRPLGHGGSPFGSVGRTGKRGDLRCHFGAQLPGEPEAVHHAGFDARPAPHLALRLDRLADFLPGLRAPGGAGRTGGCGHGASGAWPRT